MAIKTVATNRKARHEYFLLETLEAGLELRGSEIKSIRAGQISLAEAYVQVDGKQAWLIDAHVAPYEQASRFNHDPRRPRRLLLHSAEIKTPVGHGAPERGHDCPLAGLSEGRQSQAGNCCGER